MLIRAYADCIMTTRGAIRASPDARTEGGAHILARQDELSGEIYGVWTEAPSRLADLARFAACQRAHINEIDVARHPTTQSRRHRCVMGLRTSV
jgi:hypothetical protein